MPAEEETIVCISRVSKSPTFKEKVNVDQHISQKSDILNTLIKVLYRYVLFYLLAVLDHWHVAPNTPPDVLTSGMIVYGLTFSLLYQTSS